MFAARLLLLLLAGGLAAAAIVTTLRSVAPASASHAYVCPMHPQVTSAGPSQCPICRMELEPTAAGGARPVAPTAARADANPAHAYVCPMHPEIGGATPGSCSLCKMDLEPRVVSATVPAKAPDPKYGPGVLWLPETFPHAPPPRAQVAIAAAKPHTFVSDVRAPASVDRPDHVVATLYRDEIAGLAAGAPAAFYLAMKPRFPVAVRLGAEPATPWDQSTVRIRFIVDPEPPQPADAAPGALPAAPGALRPGDIGWIELKGRTRTLLSVPKTALLRSKAGPYVLVPNPDGHGYARRPLEIGRILQGHAAVLGGLREGESVVVGGAFFLDAAMGHESSNDAVAGGPG